MTEVTPDDAATRGALCSLERDRAAVVREKRWARGLYRLIWIFGFLAVICLMVLWLARVQASLARMEHRLALTVASRLGDSAQANAEVSTLEARLARVLSASVESKLRRLEHSVERGTLGGEDLQLLEAVAGELRLLRSHPPPEQTDLLRAPTAEHPRYQPVAPVGGAASGADTLGQVAELRTLVYTVVVCLALLLTIALGLWYSTARQVRLIATMPRRQLVAMRTSRENQRGG